MTTVLALDLAKNSGWSVTDATGTIAAGSWKLNAGLAESGKRALPLDTRHVVMVQRLRLAVTEIIVEHDVDVVAVEREFGRGVGSRLLVSLYTGANEAAFDSGCATLGITISAWRGYVHGSSKGSTTFFKSRALAVCKADGVDVPDSDAAEAVLIGQYVSKTMRVTPAVQPMRAAA